MQSVKCCLSEDFPLQVPCASDTWIIWYALPKRLMRHLSKEIFDNNDTEDNDNKTNIWMWNKEMSD